MQQKLQVRQVAIFSGCNFKVEELKKTGQDKQALGITVSPSIIHLHAIKLWSLKKANPSKNLVGL